MADRMGDRVILREPESKMNDFAGDGRIRGGDGDAVVIDLGSSELRAGFSSSKDPELRFPPLVSRARDPGPDGRRKNFVGFDAIHTSVRSGARSPFELNIPFNASLLERLLDGTMVLLGLQHDERIDRPFVLTEPVCQMNGARSLLMEVLFEGYQSSAVCLGVDALFSYLYNSRRSQDAVLSYGRRDALVLSSSFRTTHVLPVVDARFCASSAKRINVGGDQATKSLMQRLKLLHPIFAPLFSYDRVNLLKEEVCYFPVDFHEELNRLTKDPDYFDKMEKIVEIPAEDAARAGPPPEELERQKALRAESGKRLQEMMKDRKKNSKRSEDTKPAAEPEKLTSEETDALEALFLELDELDAIEGLKFAAEDEYYVAMAKRGFTQKKDMHSAIDNLRTKIDAKRSELGQDRVDAAEAAWRKARVEDALVETPDPLLSQAQLKEKRKVKSMRGAAEARRRIKEQKEEERLKVERKEAEAARKKEEDPQGYLQALMTEREELIKKIKLRKAAKEAGSDRRSQASRNRMRLLAQQIQPEGEGKRDGDNFGARDEDWNAYHEIHGADSEEENQDEERLNTLKEEISSMRPDLMAAEDADVHGADKLYYPVTRHNEIDVCVDRIRTPEIIWQPSIVGLDQCGLSESIGLSLDTLPGGRTTRDSVVQEVFLTGGMFGTPGTQARMVQEIRQLLPAELFQDQPLNVWVAKDPVLDAWRGAALLAREGGSIFKEACVSRKEYDEMGPEYLNEHFASNVYYKRPSDPERENKKRRR